MGHIVRKKTVESVSCSSSRLILLLSALIYSTRQKIHAISLSMPSVISKPALYTITLHRAQAIWFHFPRDYVMIHYSEYPFRCISSFTGVLACVFVHTARSAFRYHGEGITLDTLYIKHSNTCEWPCGCGRVHPPYRYLGI